MNIQSTRFHLRGGEIAGQATLTNRQTREHRVISDADIPTPGALMAMTEAEFDAQMEAARDL